MVKKDLCQTCVGNLPFQALRVSLAVKKKKSTSVLLSLCLLNTFSQCVNCQKKKKNSNVSSFPFLLQSPADVVQGGESAPKKQLLVGQQLTQEVYVGCRAGSPVFQPAQGMKQ